MRVRSKILSAAASCALLAAGCAGPETVELDKQGAFSEPEIFYHMFQRSFYDSNGDLNGDLQGVITKLDYLQDLGITSILLLPLYPSPYHHNYFADDFEGIDAEYGDMSDYIALVEAVHARGMKIYMDTEIQYATERHKWYKDAYNNPDSPYDDYLLFTNSDNTEAATIIFDISHLESHDGQDVKITTVNLASEGVKAYMSDLFKFWADPNQDGDFSDGVDGFRIDHMMDDLDDKGILKNLFTDFWKPLFDDVHSVNPKIKIIAEQADWTDTGATYFEKAGIDLAFGFSIREGLLTLNKNKIERGVTRTFTDTPAGKDQLIFLENHDVPRYATVVEGVDGRVRVGAAFSLLSKGVPLIYYGQELGMKGLGGIGKDFGEAGKDDWDTGKPPSPDDLQKLMKAIKNTTVNDGADIAVREAFEWYADVDGPGMAYWYKPFEQWWSQTFLKPNDGVSLEEQRGDPGSLWNFYRDLISLRKSHSALFAGNMNFIPTKSDDLIVFSRAADGEKLLVAINLGEDSLSEPITGLQKNSALLWGIGASAEGDADGLVIDMQPYGVGVWSY